MGAVVNPSFSPCQKRSWPSVLSLMTAAGFAVAVAAPRAAEAAASASWTFNYLNGLTGNITVTTNSTSTLLAGTQYAIDSITGSMDGVNITGLTSSTTSYFWYNPLSSAEPIQTDANGINYTTTDLVDWTIYYSLTGHGVPDFFFNTTNPQGGTIQTAGTPVPSQGVPTPLPIFGISAAYGMSRRLRRRVKASA
jgi:hypothetical protein